MSTGVSNCYFADPDIGKRPNYEGQCDEGSISNGLVFIQDANCAANETEIEKGKRKQEEDHFVKAPKRLRLGSIWYVASR